MVNNLKSVFNCFKKYLFYLIFTEKIYKTTHITGTIKIIQVYTVKDTNITLFYKISSSRV